MCRVSRNSGALTYQKHQRPQKGLLYLLSIHGDGYSYCGFSVLRVAKYADANPKKDLPFVCEHGDLLHFEFTSASVSSLNIVTPPPCFIKLHLFLFACGNYAIPFDKPQHLYVMLGLTQISVSTD